MKLYLAGPMSGIPDLNRPLFNRIAASLRALGHEVVNPAEVNAEGDAMVPFMTEVELAAHWVACMKADIAQLVTCEGIALLPGWDSSRGATIEHRLATDLRMPVFCAMRLCEEVTA